MGDDATATVRATGTSDDARAFALAVGGLLLVVAVATLIALGAKVDLRYREPGFAIPLGDRGIFVPFEGADNPAHLPQMPKGRVWSIHNGTWGTLAGDAYVAEPVAEEGTTMALLPAPNDASTLVRLEVVADNSGLVFRVQDPLNYLAVRVRTRDEYVELVQVTNGRSTSLARSARVLAMPDGAALRVIHEGTSAKVTIDGISVLDSEIPAAVGETKAGLITSGPQATVARFDDLTILPLEFVRR